jgi:hypothetical protein
MGGIMPTFSEAFRQGVMARADITVQGRPWPFDLG